MQAAPDRGLGRVVGVVAGARTQRHDRDRRVLEPTTVLVLDARQLVTLCEHNPRFGYEFMRRTALALSQRSSATRLQLLDVYHHELPVHPEPREV